MGWASTKTKQRVNQHPNSPGGDNSLLIVIHRAMIQFTVQAFAGSQINGLHSLIKWKVDCHVVSS
jgi:hypothetical protein